MIVYIGFYNVTLVLSVWLVNATYLPNQDHCFQNVNLNPSTGYALPCYGVVFYILSISLNGYYYYLYKIIIVIFSF